MSSSGSSILAKYFDQSYNIEIASVYPQQDIWPILENYLDVCSYENTYARFPPLSRDRSLFLPEKSLRMWGGGELISRTAAGNRAYENT